MASKRDKLADLEAQSAQMKDIFSHLTTPKEETMTTAKTNPKAKAPKATTIVTALVEDEVLDLATFIKAGKLSIDAESITAQMYTQFKFQDFEVFGSKEVCQVTFKADGRTNWIKFGKAAENVVTMWSKSWQKKDAKGNPVVVNGKKVYEYSKFSNVNGTRMPDGDWKTEGRPREMDIRKAAIAVLKAFYPEIVVADRVY